MKLGDVVKLVNFTMVRTLCDLSTGIEERFENDQYNGVLAMITRIVDDSTYMVDILPQYLNRIDTDNGWRVKGLLMNYHNLEATKTNPFMEVE